MHQAGIVAEAQHNSKQLICYDIAFLCKAPARTAQCTTAAATAESAATESKGHWVKHHLNTGRHTVAGSLSSEEQKLKADRG